MQNKEGLDSLRHKLSSTQERGMQDEEKYDDKGTGWLVFCL
jgi:hypothetical protein